MIIGVSNSYQNYAGSYYTHTCTCTHVADLFSNYEKCTLPTFFTKIDYSNSTKSSKSVGVLIIKFKTFTDYS